MNIKLEYLYRDAGNFKNYGEVIFSNPNNIALDIIASMVEKVLIDNMYFVASKVGLPDLRFAEYIPHLDHDWHEVDALQPTNDLPNDPGHRNIEEFIESLRQKSDSDLSWGYFMRKPSL